MTDLTDCFENRNLTASMRWRALRRRLALVAFAMAVAFGCQAVPAAGCGATNDFHVSFRLRTDGPVNGPVPLLKSAADSLGCFEVRLASGADAGRPCLRTDGATRLTASYRVDDGAWHEIALIGHDGRLALMVDEFVEAEADCPAAAGALAPDLAACRLKGEIADLRIDRAARLNPAVVPVAELERNSYDWTNRHLRIVREAKGLDPELVLIGDSITHAWAGPQLSIGGPDAGWVWKRDFGGIRALNLGYGFDRTQNLLWRIDNGELDGLNPKVVVVLAGINNLGTRRRKLHARGNTSWETAAGVRAVRERIAKKLPATHVLVMGVFPRGRDRLSIYRSQPAAVNELLRKAYENDANTTYVDAGPALLDKDGTLSPEVSHDSVHLTPEGFRRWRAVLDPYLKKHL